MRIVRLEYDYACNFKCVHCDIRDYQKKSERRALTPDDVAELAEQADALGFGQFVISGGEPLVYPDFDAVVKAIDPERFYITTDSNGWLLDEERTAHLKDIGISKVQISIDSLDANSHDSFRRKRGAFSKALRAVFLCRDAGLNTIVQTVVDKQRVRSDELIEFIKFFDRLKVPIYIQYAKPVGAWKGRWDVMIDESDMHYIEGLEKQYSIFTHLSPAYNYQGGCIAVKRMINITKWGDLNPCPVMQELVIGNIFDEPLKDIMVKAEQRFSKHIPVCLMAMDKGWIDVLLT